MNALPNRHVLTKDNFCCLCAGNNRKLCRRSCQNFPPTLLVFSPAEKSNWGIILKSHLSLVGSIQKSWPDTPFRINGTAHARRQTFFRHWRRRQWAWRHPFAKRVMFASERRGYHLQDQQDWFPYGLLMNMKRDDIKSSKFSTKNFGSSRKL